MAAFAAADFSHAAPRSPAAQRGLRCGRGWADACRGGAVGSRRDARCGHRPSDARTTVAHRLLAGRTADTAETVFGTLYTGFLLAYIVLLRSYDSGLVLALAVVLSVWLNDVGAYLVGSTIGQHKMAPRVSPKKSWEGLAAGTLACMGLWDLFRCPQAGIELPFALACGVAVAVASVVGDLAESRMKREAGVKDSGTILPGHGGFLDRLDSLILVCVVAYWVFWWGGVR